MPCEILASARIGRLESINLSAAWLGRINLITVPIVELRLHVYIRTDVLHMYALSRHVCTWPGLRHCCKDTFTMNYSDGASDLVS